MSPEHTFLAQLLVWIGQWIIANADSTAAQILATGGFAVTLVGLLTRYAPLLAMLRPLLGPVWRAVQPLLSAQARTTPKDGK